MKSTCILVVGLPRSGTSMIGGVLHNLGVNMGGQSNSHPKLNPMGFFEDMVFGSIHCNIIGAHGMDYLVKGLEIKRGIPDDLLAPYKIIIQEREKRRLWGLKDPRLFLFIEDFVRLLDSNLKAIHIWRKPEAVIKSLNNYRYGWSIPGPDRLQRIMGDWGDLKQQALCHIRETEGDIITFCYGDVIANPQSSVETIADFVGIEPTQEAIEFIDPQLDHSRNKL